jgi:hypothetical protein
MKMLNKFVIHLRMKIANSANNANNANNANHSIASLSMFPKMILSYLWGGEVGRGENKDAKWCAPKLLDRLKCESEVKTVKK